MTVRRASCRAPRPPNGAFDVTVRDDGLTVDTSTDPWTISERSTSTIADRDFSADDFNDEGGAAATATTTATTAATATAATATTTTTATIATAATAATATAAGAARTGTGA